MQASDRCVTQMPAEANIWIKSHRISEFVWDFPPVAGTAGTKSSTSGLAKSSNPQAFSGKIPSLTCTPHTYR